MCNPLNNKSLSYHNPQNGDPVIPTVSDVKLSFSRFFYGKAGSPASVSLNVRFLARPAGLIPCGLSVDLVSQDLDLCRCFKLCPFRLLVLFSRPSLDSLLTLRLLEIVSRREGVEEFGRCDLNRPTCCQRSS